MSPPSSSFRRPANPVTQAAFRRQLRLEIYLPLGLTLLGIAVFVGVAAALSYGTPGAWADTTLILLAVPTALLLAILLSALAAASYLLLRLIREIPGFTSGLQQGVGRVSGAVQKGSGAAVRPVIIPRAILAAAAEAGRSLRSIFRAE